MMAEGFLTRFSIDDITPSDKPTTSATGPVEQASGFMGRFEIEDAPTTTGAPKIDPPVQATQDQPTINDPYELDFGVDSGDKEKNVFSMITSLAAQAGEAMFGKEEFDYTGIPDANFRSEFYMPDSEEGRVRFLTAKVGKGNFLKTPSGDWAVTPEGMEKLGMNHMGKPVVVDEPGLSWYDLADLTSDVLPMIGSLAAIPVAMAGTAAAPGLLAGAALAGIGAGIGKGVQEVGEYITGKQYDDPEAISSSMAAEAGWGALGQGVGDVISMAGRYAMAPFKSKMTPAMEQVAKDTTELGLRVSGAKITKPAIFGRLGNIARRVVGDPSAIHNATILNQKLAELADFPFGNVRPDKAGNMLTNGILSAKKSFSEWANVSYNLVDKELGGGKVIPTRELKKSALNLITKDLPLAVAKKGAKPAPIMVSAETAKMLKWIQMLPKAVSVKQMRAIKGYLYNTVDSGLLPDVSSFHASKLHQGALASFEDAISSGTVPKDAGVALNMLNKAYASRKSQFDSAFVKSLVANPKAGEYIPPEKIVEHLFKKGETTNLLKVLKIIPKPSADGIRKQAMETLLKSATGMGDDAITMIFTGRKFMGALESYGKPTLDAMFGPQKTADMYKLARTMSVLSNNKGDGALIAAAIAAHPLNNVVKIAKFAAIVRLFDTNRGMRWLTGGLNGSKAQKTKQITQILDDVFSRVSTIGIEEER